MRGMRGFASALGLGVVLWTAPSTLAADFTVDSTKDRLDGSPGNGICAASDGVCTLRAAIQEANALPGFDTINLPRGDFELTRAPSDTPGIAEGDLDITEAVSIDGVGSKKTIIRQTVEDRVILSNAVPAGIIPGALFSDVTITGGDLTTPGNQLGGGIRVDDHFFGLSKAVVRDNIVHRQHANSFGGGIAVNAPATVSIQESAVRGNAVVISSPTGSAVGGGVYIDGDTPAGSNPAMISDSVISGNKAVVKGGGAGTGGGVYARDPVDLDRVEISENRATEGGGITATQSLESADLDSVTIAKNKAAQGAGIYVGTQDPVTITNSTISSNKLVRGEERGGAAIFARLGDISIAHSTIAANNAGKRKTLYLKEISPGAITSDIRGSIVDGPKKDCLPESLGTVSTSIFGDSSCVLPGISTNLVADPKLKPLADNPGMFSINFYGPTHLLKGSSPAIDFVTSGCPPPTQDQLGHSRPPGACDAGSVERP